MDDEVSDGPLRRVQQVLAHVSNLVARYVIEPGVVLVAASNDHLVMTRNRTLSYTSEPIDCPFRPSVDVLFGSLAKHWPEPSVAVLLTGIGRDGADGLLRLRQAGWHTIAQDEATSVVYGMPQAAVQMKAAREVLPAQEIAAHISAAIKRGRHDLRKA